MKHTILAASVLAVTLSLTACGSDEKTTIVHERPVIVNPTTSGTTPSDVERNCKHGYDNASRSCY